jgi:hypothetical protein
MWTLALIVTTLLAVPEAANDPALLPDGINGILGRILPEMTETSLVELVRDFYPDAEVAGGIWSGQSGYVDFRLSDRWTLSVAEYCEPMDYEIRHVHPDLLFYVVDRELERRIDITLYQWGDAVPEDGGV